jgi:hypothetical protein
MSAIRAIFLEGDDSSGQDSLDSATFYGGRNRWTARRTTPMSAVDKASIHVGGFQLRNLQPTHVKLFAVASRRQKLLSLEDARRLVEGYVEHYNDVRAIGYITPKDMLAGHQQDIMLSEIGSWRRHENNVRFVGSRPPEEGADKPISGRSGHCKHYVVNRG